MTNTWHVVGAFAAIAGSAYQMANAQTPVFALRDLLAAKSPPWWRNRHYRYIALFVACIIVSVAAPGVVAVAAALFALGLLTLLVVLVFLWPEKVYRIRLKTQPPGELVLEAQAAPQALAAWSLVIIAAMMNLIGLDEDLAPVGNLALVAGLWGGLFANRDRCESFKLLYAVRLRRVGIEV
jgi:hypothetical protein